MVLSHYNLLQCIVVAPQGKLLSCNAKSVVFPAHDGMVGVLPNHMPMFCELGLGIMEAKCLIPEEEFDGTTFLLIDGGFAMVISNFLTIMAADAVSFKDIPPERIEHTLEKARQKFAAYTGTQRAREEKKLAMLSQLARLSTKFSPKPSATE
jgi:F-type H+-transporting ATPase subunit epsilon